MHTNEQKSPSSKRTTKQPARSQRKHAVAAYPQVVSCIDRFGHQQEIHILLQHRHKSQKNSVWSIQIESLQESHPFYTYAPIQYTLLDRYINGSVCKAPTHPPGERLKGSVSPLLLFPKCQSISYLPHFSSPGSRSSCKATILASTKATQEIVPIKGLTRFYLPQKSFKLQGSPTSLNQGHF